MQSNITSNIFTKERLNKYNNKDNKLQPIIQSYINNPLHYTNKLNINNKQNKSNQAKSNQAKSNQAKSNQAKSNQAKSNQAKSDQKYDSNLGFYIPYSIIEPDSSYEYLDELSLMVKNINRSLTSGYNIFKWKNILDNKIHNMMYIYIHILSISLFPFIEKNLTTDVEKAIVNYIVFNIKKIKTDQHIEFILGNNAKKIISISYIGLNYIDFIVNFDFNSSYSIEFNQMTPKNMSLYKVYKYTRSTKSIIDEPFLYVDIDSNDNLNNNVQLDTSMEKKKFTFKISPITISSSYVYYKGLGQYLLKTLNELITLDSVDITIYDSTYKVLSNTHINKDLSNQISEKKITYCECLNNFDIDNNNYFKPKPSCYCLYLRHPLHKDNQIDISFKFGQIKNEQINNIFH
jgi:hypothetical protein